MSVTSGFFNSFNGDRRYNAAQMSAIFDGIINDGVFANIGTAFGVNAGAGVTVNVGTGRCWFNSTWLLNDAILPIVCDISEMVLDRIDAIVIEIDHSDSVRSGSIKFLKGTPSSEPQRPTMADTDDVHQYPLAYIYRKATSGTITQSDITNMVGTSSCPYITGILQVQNIDNIVAQWRDQWNQWFTKTVASNEQASSQWLAEIQAEFDAWFENLQASLAPDVAANLAAQVLELQERFVTLATEGSVYDDLKDSNGEAILDSYESIVLGKTTFSSEASSDNSVGSIEIKELRQLIDTKQDKLFGSSDQIVGFDSTGKAIPVNISMPKSVKVTLNTSSWSGNSQTVSVPGVMADETKQLIQPVPSATSQTAYETAGIRCTNQQENKLTFTAKKTPSSTIIVYVVIQEVRTS